MRTGYVRSGVLALVVAATALLPGGTAGAGAGPSGGALDRTIVHGVPQVPLTIDGVSVPAASITKYNGTPLYMAAMPDAANVHGRLVAFTSPADFESFVRKNGGPEHAMAKPKEWTPEMAASHPRLQAPGRPDAASTTGNGSVDRTNATYIYSGDWYSYFGMGVAAGWGYRDLTRVDMFCFVFCINWNDEASSTWADTYQGQMLWEHTNWSGSTLWVAGGYAVPYLSRFGWDNRVSSFGSY